MEFNKAKIIAEKYLQMLKPFCERIEIAGSTAGLNLKLAISKLFASLKRK
jgi:hypothetical protein